MTRTLKAEECRAVCDPGLLALHTTADVPPMDGMVGQGRALEATAFGMGIRHHGYNLFVLGPSATGKTTTMRRLIATAAEADPPAPDLCYVHNFADAYRPRVLAVPAGRGVELREEMQQLVDECRERLPRVFEGEEFERQKARILESLSKSQEAEVDRLEQATRAAGFVLLRTPAGLAVAPARRGQPLTAEEFRDLPSEERARLEQSGRALEGELEAAHRRLRDLEREARRAHGALVREVAAAATRGLIGEVRETFAGIQSIQQYLDAVEHDLVEHAEELRRRPEKPALPIMPSPDAFLDRYRVNVLVDGRRRRGAPVVFEQNPTHANLVGRIEHHAYFGTLVTDFTLIKPGALHRANGGYLILEARDVLRNFMAWETLKKALKSGTIRIEEPLEELRSINAVTLAPEPIPLSVKIVLIGSPLLYYLLYALDEDFGELFKVKVDFDESMPRTPDTELAYARFVASACRDEQLPAFSAEAVARLVEHGSRMVADQHRLSARLGLLLDLVREAAFCAQRAGHTLVAGEDVVRAIADKRRRVNLVEERLGRMISEGALLIATEGEVVGQVNGISVLRAGDHIFGRPSRITVRTSAGEPGVVDIEREAKLGGPVHSKGVMILTGFLAGRYARQRPLTVSASIAFEQQYDEIEGDSASSAELYALLSSLAGIPLRQSVGVTGSVNQHGEIQPVGGVNEKIEGFFDVCLARGLTGDQGVLIPEANVRHLMLRDDVVAAVREGRFHVWTAGTVDEGMALLTGRPSGERGPDGTFPEGTVNAAIDQALAESLARFKELGLGRSH